MRWPIGTTITGEACCREIQAVLEKHGPITALIGVRITGLIPETGELEAVRVVEFGETLADWLLLVVDADINEARALERERCARLAEFLYKGLQPAFEVAGSHIAERIRSLQ